jgi:hypothetical protein
LVGKLAVAVLLVTAACGRIGYDEHRLGPGSIDGPNAAQCPPDMRATAPSGKVCIEVTKRGSATWVEAKATCTGLGRRLCADDEWLFACNNTAGLMNMAGGPGTDWEWMADLVDPTTAKKRGFNLCTDESSHGIEIDPTTSAAAPTSSSSAPAGRRSRRARRRATS